MVKRKRAALLPTNIALLQNLVRRDPQSYKEEFLLQFKHYQSLRDIHVSAPATEESSESAQEFAELIGFVSQVCICYPKETAQFPEELERLLKERHHELHPELREKMVQCLIMLKNKGVIGPEAMIKALFPVLVETGSKVLRGMIYSGLVTMLKTENVGTRNQKLNKQVQALLFNLLEDEQNEKNGLWATKLTRELWRRGIWDDSRTVEIMTKATSSKNLKVACSGARFFLGADKEREEAQLSEDEEEEIDMTAVKHKMQVNKKTGRRGKQLESAMKKAAKKKSGPKSSATYLNFSAIHLLRDPQGFADSLFSRFLTPKSHAGLDLEQKILFTNLVSRLIGSHKLILLSIYSYFLKYLTPKQRDVTQFMAAAAQACHDLVPPEAITPMVKKIADEFVSDGVQSEVAAAGLNTIREIAARAPLALDETLLHDLTEYKGSKAKNVVMAARGLIGVYREIMPEMLQRKDRGKEATMGISAGTNKSVRYGVATSEVDGIKGLELLQQWKEENANPDEPENENDGWEVASNDSDSDIEGNWVEVESDKEYNVSDSEDEEKDENGEPVAKKPKITQTEAELSLASTRLLTPQDFAKLDELRRLGPTATHDSAVEASTLIGPQKFKQAREERIAHAKSEEAKHGSRRGQIAGAHSTTNREKARKKNFVMMIHKKDVQGKAKRSLRDKKRLLRAHIEKQKKKGY